MPGMNQAHVHHVRGAVEHLWPLKKVAKIALAMVRSGMQQQPHQSWYALIRGLQNALSALCLVAQSGAA